MRCDSTFSHPVHPLILTYRVRGHAERDAVREVVEQEYRQVQIVIEGDSLSGRIGCYRIVSDFSPPSPRSPSLTRTPNIPRFPRREDVDRSNQTRMTHLKTAEEVYTAVDGGTITDPTQREKMLANFMPPRTLVLREDAQVMLIKNTDENLVNGSMGRVVRFVDPALFGTEADVGYGLGGSGGGGETGVIGEGMGGSGAGPGKKASAVVGNVQLYPVVEFLLPNGGKKSMVVTPEVWKVELPSGEVQVSRTQVKFSPIAFIYLFLFAFILEC